MNKMMTKVKETGQYIQKQTASTIESLKGLRNRRGTYARVPTNEPFDDVLQETKNTN